MPIATISESARIYGEGVLELAKSDGYIDLRIYSEYNAQPRSYSDGGDYNFCCCPCGCPVSNDDAKGFLALVAAVAGAASLVSIGFLARSSFQLASYVSQKKQGQEKKEMEEEPGNTTAEVSKAVYDNAELLLNGMVKERTWTTISLATVTVGTVLLTIAAITALVTHPYLFGYAAQIKAYAICGGVLTGMGLTSFAVAQGYYRGYRLNHEAGKLKESLSGQGYRLNREAYQLGESPYPSPSAPRGRAGVELEEKDPG